VFAVEMFVKVAYQCKMWILYFFLENLKKAKGRELSDAVSILDQWYSTYFVCILPDVISLNVLHPELLVYNSGYTPSTTYI
jgi:hypothetical protein